jgi:hypothetical protein
VAMSAYQGPEVSGSSETLRLFASDLAIPAIRSRAPPVLWQRHQHPRISTLTIVPHNQMSTPGNPVLCDPNHHPVSDGIYLHQISAEPNHRVVSELLSVWASKLFTSCNPHHVSAMYLFSQPSCFSSSSHGNQVFSVIQSTFFITLLPESRPHIH